MTPNLTQLANRFGTDKGSLVGHAHDYARFYSFLFEQFRNDAFSMLEIGLLRGGVEDGRSADRPIFDAPSIRMWLEFFPRATCFGFDISDFSHLSIERFKFFQGDLSSVDDLRKLAATLPPLRLAIDDGSHASFHQQSAFVHLFDKIIPGGFYVIEDFHWQPPFENSLPACWKTAEVFESYLQTGEINIGFVPPDVSKALSKQIANVFVHRNDTGGVNRWTLKMVAIQKR